MECDTDHDGFTTRAVFVDLINEKKIRLPRAVINFILNVLSVDVKGTKFDGEMPNDNNSDG